MTSRAIPRSPTRRREISLPPPMRSRAGCEPGFVQFTAFSQDAKDKDNEIFERVKLPMPVLAVGGEKSFGPVQALIMRNVATNVQEAVVTGSGHWLMEERPRETVALI